MSRYLFARFSVAVECAERKAGTRGLYIKIKMLRLIQSAARLNRFQRKICSQSLWNSCQTVAQTQGLRWGAALPTTRHFHNSQQHERELREYDEVFKKSIEEPEDFWGGLADEIDWYKPFAKVMDNTKPPFTKW